MPEPKTNAGQTGQTPAFRPMFIADLRVLIVTLSASIVIFGCRPSTHTAQPEPNIVAITSQTSKPKQHLPGETKHTPMQIESSFKGPPSQILVLGTTHLARREGVDPRVFSLLLSKLEAWKPDIIAVETNSGLLCDVIKRQAKLMPDFASSNCKDTSHAQALTGHDVVSAQFEIRQRLATPTKSRTDTQRKELIALLFAADEPESAFSHWLRLSSAHQKPDKILSPELVTRLQKMQAKHSEVEVIAAELASRLDLGRLVAVDDSTYGRALFGHIPELEQVLLKLQSNPSVQNIRRQREEMMPAWEKHRTTAQGVLEFYRKLNNPALDKLIFQADFGAALQDDSPGLFGRHYVAGWETRNLRMVANIREAMINKPGAKVLAIVGRSHKYYYETYLRALHDIQIVDVQDVLQ